MDRTFCKFDFQETTHVSEQARFINLFENEETKYERSIWENVIILARKGFNNRDDEGFQVFKMQNINKHIDPESGGTSGSSKQLQEHCPMPWLQP